MHWFHTRLRSSLTVADLELQEHLQRHEIHLLSEMGAVFGRLEGWMRLFGYPTLDIFSVQLALREAIRNAFEHGNRGNPARSVRVSFLVNADEVLLGVEDQGAGYDPQQVIDSAGRGLLLMRAYMTWMSIEAPGNRVLLCRVRTHFPTAAPSGALDSAGPKG
jgi:anti-sigma regulatory factor (Ser/Thr protein kinase)